MISTVIFALLEILSVSRSLSIVKELQMRKIKPHVGLEVK